VAADIGGSTAVGIFAAGMLPADAAAGAVGMLAAGACANVANQKFATGFLS